MRTPHEPGAATVVAAQRGEDGALDELVAAYLPLVYNVVGHALGGHPDTDDVVQETMLRAVDSLGELRDPAAFRSWLLVIAMNQVRERHRRRLPLPVDERSLADRADPGADFVDLALTKLHLTGQRREVVAATRWLGEEERELLSLWWMEAVGRITRAELVEAVGISAQHAAVRVQRMKAQLDASRVVVRVLAAVPRCGELAHVVGDWDGQPSALWRKRVMRHARECDRCAAAFDDLAAVDGLVARLPLVPVPFALDPALWGAAGGEALVGQGAGHGSGHAGTAKSLKAVSSAKKGFWAQVAAKPLVVATAVAAVATAAVVAPMALPADEPPPLAAELTVPPAFTTEPLPTSSAAPTTTTAPSSSSPAPTTTTTQPQPAVAAPRPPAAPSAKKGVSTWNFDGVGKALGDVGAGWVYNWAPTREDLVIPQGVEFVPMIWGAKTVTPANLAAVKGQGGTLLGFNEPDLGEQSNMSVEQALDLWPQLQATGMRLGSPAVAYGGDKAGGWLDRFMAGARQRGLRVDFITLHWYGSDFSAAAVGHLKNYLDAVHARYGLPVWVTEYSLIDWSGGAARYPSATELAAFASGSARMMEGLPWVERYAWFALPADKPGTGLYRPGGAPNAAGEAYRSVG
ncbi:sigma-70 family RNA polymerase sigma factor [Actinosynnema pretiosum]|uniref:RNA polymerase subunit sigma n=1 Tax=Actinosynnema pretiosum TaxID=42197 RepID=A0A290ZCA5_9PSEU|nr:sigma-70 family RNA polymerase sigma factor [Actinosynnema pretiosum]ATE56626.1 RNA polymerase subunit sigma [Actinosynnema pretiosum]